MKSERLRTRISRALSAASMRATSCASSTPSASARQPNNAPNNEPKKKKDNEPKKEAYRANEIKQVYVSKTLLQKTFTYFTYTLNILYLLTTTTLLVQTYRANDIDEVAAIGKEGGH